MRWNAEQVRQKSAQDAGLAWIDTIPLVPLERGGFAPRQAPGASHPLFSILSKFTDSLLKEGFSEVNLPLSTSESDLAMQLSSEAVIVLGSSAHLASQPIPHLRIDEARFNAILALAPSFTLARAKMLEEILSEYRSGAIGPQAMLEEMVERLGLRPEQTTLVIEKVFPELAQRRKLNAEAVLRSTMSQSWFPTLGALRSREVPPLQLFAFGPCFRQGEGQSLSMSFVVADPVASLKDGLDLASKMFAIWAMDATFVPKPAPSRCFTPGTHNTVLCKGAAIGEAGMFSPVALSNYGIDMPVFYMSFDVERAAALSSGVDDSKKIAFPQFFGEWRLSDKELASQLRIVREPVTEFGKELCNRIVKTAELYGTKQAPCEFKVLEKDIGDFRFEAYLSADAGTLCGPGMVDEIVVFNGNVMLLPPTVGNDDTLAKVARKSGLRTGITLFNAFASLASAAVEKEPTKEATVAVGRVSSGADANIEVPELIYSYAKYNKLKVSLDSNLGMRLVTRVKPLWKHEQPR